MGSDLVDSEPGVKRERLGAGHDHEVFRQRLGDDEPIEGIAVVQR
jgi:hypothetical protein